jgi:hypothetical protein
MNEVAILSADQRFELFQETALKRGQQPTIIEKDFWVCWILRQLFDIEEIRSALLFKGGTIMPFAAEEFPDVFDEPSCAVKAIKAERTFWEKATILHAEHHRPPDKPLPGNHARHYYDMAMLARSPVGAQAAQDLELLRRMVEHKRKFYYVAWARYDLAEPGTLSLVPPESRLGELADDYEAMSLMIFGEAPPLEYIIDELHRLERSINESTA